MFTSTELSNSDQTLVSVNFYPKSCLVILRNLDILKIHSLSFLSSNMVTLFSSSCLGVILQAINANSAVVCSLLNSLNRCRFSGGVIN